MFKALQLASRGCLKQFVDREAALGFFLCHMQLQQHIHDAVDASRLLVDQHQQLQRIDALNHAHMRHNHAHLVGLQFANEVPLHIVGHLRSLCHQFLGTILAKDALASLVGFHQALHRVELRHRNKFHARRQLTVQSGYVVSYWHLIPPSCQQVSCSNRRQTHP